MTRATLLALLLVLAVAQPPPTMPPPGNPGHQEPAPGASCVHAGPGVNEGQACHCEPMCMDREDGTQERTEDNVRCRAACHPAHCSCRSECAP